MLYTVIDVETSGLERTSSVLSFAYMLTDENLNVKRAEVLYFWKEGVTQWTEEAYAINGLSKEFLREHASEYENNLQKMYVVLSRANIVGYNSGWVGDDKLLHGFDLPKCLSLLSGNNKPEPQYERLFDLMHILSGKRMKLQTAFDKFVGNQMLADAYSMMYFPAETATAHNAAYDVVMTALLFQAMDRAGYFNETADINAGATLLESQYVLTIKDNALAVKDKTTGEVTLLETVRHINPELYKSITENSQAYMEG